MVALPRLHNHTWLSFPRNIFLRFAPWQSLDGQVFLCVSVMRFSWRIARLYFISSGTLRDGRRGGLYA